MGISFQSGHSWDKEIMKTTIQYLWLTLKHKVFVFRAGLRTGAPLWRLIIHDWSKFMPAEAPYYGRQFFGAADDPLGFSKAWLHHQHINPHHWEYWILVSGHNRGGFKDLDPLPMPMWAVREMVADWMGATRAYEGEWPINITSWGWFQKEWVKIALRMHPETIVRVEDILGQTYPECAGLPCFHCEGKNITFFDNGSPCYDLPCPVCAARRYH